MISQEHAETAFEDLGQKASAEMTKFMSVIANLPQDQRDRFQLSMTAWILLNGAQSEAAHYLRVLRFGHDESMHMAEKMIRAAVPNLP